MKLNTVEGKMVNTNRRALRHVIEETSWAYRAFLRHEYMNSDYADFAGMALEEFKGALQAPDLTREDLEMFLRKGMKKHRRSAPDSCWTTFMSRYVERKAANVQNA